MIILLQYVKWLVPEQSGTCHSGQLRAGILEIKLKYDSYGTKWLK